MSTDDWPTPQWLVDQLAAEFGPFDLDPAASAANTKASAYYTRDDDGLAQEWKGRVWLNSPYGRELVPWLAKARAEVAAGRAEIVVCLVPVRTGTKWWLAATASAALVRYWPRRIEFGSTDGVPGAPGFDSAIIVYGTLPRRHGTTPAWCTACRKVFWPARDGAKTCGDTCRKARQRSRQTSSKRDIRRAS